MLITKLPFKILAIVLLDCLQDNINMNSCCIVRVLFYLRTLLLFSSYYLYGYSSYSHRYLCNFIALNVKRLFSLIFRFVLNFDCLYSNLRVPHQQRLSLPVSCAQRTALFYLRLSAPYIHIKLNNGQ